MTNKCTHLIAVIIMAGPRKHLNDDNKYTRTNTQPPSPAPPHQMQNSLSQCGTKKLSVPMVCASTGTLYAAGPGSSAVRPSVYVR